MLKLIKKILFKLGFGFVGEVGLPDTQRNNCLQLIVYFLLIITLIILVK